jgi:uncharacterized membrane protein YuzA (DUF378 family)
MGFMGALGFLIISVLNDIVGRHGLPVPLPDTLIYGIISLLVGLAALIPLSFHINYWEERSEYSEPRCRYCEKLLPAGDEARELHRIRHALESIETVLTDLVERVRT